METILEIEEFFGEKLEKSEYNWSTFDGFRIKTSEKELVLAISDGASCCENFGTISTEDDFEEFIGAEIRNILITEGNLTSELMENLSKEYVSSDETEFITLETTKGTLQFAVYNSHNGYYGHSVYIQVGEEVTNTGL